LGHAVEHLVQAQRYKPEGSIADGVIGIFHWLNPSGRTMALESNQPLREISARNIYWGVNEACAQGWQPHHFMCRFAWNLGPLTSWNPLGLFRPLQGLLYLFTKSKFRKCMVGNVRSVIVSNCWFASRFKRQAKLSVRWLRERNEFSESFF
jgi:hypothetical protein